jgi:hypothetical protein
MFSTNARGERGGATNVAEQRMPFLKGKKRSECALTSDFTSSLNKITIEE